MPRPRPVQVRPRKGSVLEFVQVQTGNQMNDLLHDWAASDESWAESFRTMREQSDKGNDDG